jgi:hypothetical protein
MPERYKKILRKIICIVLIFVLFVVSINIYRLIKERPYNDKSVLDSAPIDDIEKALFLVVNDSRNDWDQVYEAPQDGVYPYPPVDIHEVYMGVYKGRLYVKFVLGGEIPEKQEIIANNTIKNLSYIMSMQMRSQSSWHSWQELGRSMVGLILRYEDNGNIAIGPCYWANLTSSEDVTIGGVTYEGIYEKEGNGILHTGNGGFGKNYFIISFSLADDLLGTIYVGQDVHLSGGAEVESNLYHHFSHDSFEAGIWTTVPAVQEIQVQ